MKSIKYRLFAIVVLFFQTFIFATVSYSGNRADVIEVLETIPQTWSNANLYASLNEGSNIIELDQNLVFNFRADVNGYLSFFHVNSHGQAIVVFPESSDQGNLLIAGVGKFYPAHNDSLEFKAEPPLGKENVYVVITQHPLSRNLLSEVGDSNFVQLENSLTLAKRYVSAIKETARSGPVAMVRLQHQIEGKPGQTQYKTRDIVKFFTKKNKFKTRSLERPLPKSLPATQVRFRFNSDILITEGKINLDTFGEALVDNKMKTMRFDISGHTDSIGSKEYNLTLSRRRAQAAANYLLNNFDIHPNRLIVKAYGESRPLKPNDSPKNRAKNRRVQFEEILPTTKKVATISKFGVAHEKTAELTPQINFKESNRNKSLSKNKASANLEEMNARDIICQAIKAACYPGSEICEEVKNNLKVDCSINPPFSP